MSEKPGLKAFGVVLFAEGISQLGSALTGFAMGIWAYQQHGQVTDFALIATAASLPRVLLSPFAGNLVDRWDRKTILVLGQVASFIATLIIAILYWTDSLAIWHMIVLNIIGSACGAVVLPALSASVSSIVDKKDIQRANGMAALAIGLIQVFSPIMAGALMTSIGIDGILILNLISFSSGMLALWWIRIPPLEKSTHGAQAVEGKFFAEMLFGWKFLYDRRGLFWLTCFNSLIGLGVMAMGIMFTPIVLGFTDEAGLGMVLTAGGVGMVVGSLAVIITGGTKRKVFAVLFTSALASIGLIITPIFASVWPVAIGGFLVMATFPLGATASQAIFQHKVPNDVQGRVFGFRNFITGISGPLSLPIIGPIADAHFEPLLVEGGTLVQSLGWLYGTGTGRGVALMTSLIGFILLIVVILACMIPSIRQVDIDLPDYLDDDPKKRDQNPQNENRYRENS